jgi:hypothetical protein
MDKNGLNLPYFHRTFKSGAVKKPEVSGFTLENPMYSLKIK